MYRNENAEISIFTSKAVRSKAYLKGLIFNREMFNNKITKEHSF